MLDQGRREIAVVVEYCLWTGQELGWYRNGQYPAGLTNTLESPALTRMISRYCRCRVAALVFKSNDYPKRNEMKTGSRGLLRRK